MRTINIKAGNVMHPIKNYYPEDRHMCWHATLDRSEERADWTWRIGSKHEGVIDECSFVASDVGDVDDDSVWAKITGIEFGIKLIELFKSGREVAIKDWIKNGSL